MDILAILGYALYLFVLINILRAFKVIREPVKKGIGVTKPTVNIQMLCLLSVIIVPILKLSPFHLLWMIPASYFLGYFSYIFCTFPYL